MSGLSYMQLGIALWFLSWFMPAQPDWLGFTVFIGSYVVMFWGI